MQLDDHYGFVICVSRRCTSQPSPPNLDLLVQLGRLGATLLLCPLLWDVQLLGDDGPGVGLVVLKCGRDGVLGLLELALLRWVSVFLVHVKFDK